MAAPPPQDQEVQQQALFPPPPPYFALAAQGRLAPPPPLEGEYTQFGEIYTTEDGLPALQVRRLYETTANGGIDYKKELSALHRELAVNFVELLEVLVERPSGYARQVENVGLVLRNLMFLANQMRPPQARATLLQALSSDEKRAAVERLQQGCARGEGALQAAVEAIEMAETAAAGGGGNTDNNAAADMDFVAQADGT